MDDFGSRKHSLGDSVARFWHKTTGVTSMEFALYAAATTLALGLIVVPWLDDLTSPNGMQKGEIDTILTGSVPVSPVSGSGTKKIQRISRSILQDPSGPPCIQYTDGTNNGNC